MSSRQSIVSAGLSVASAATLAGLVWGGSAGAWIVAAAGLALPGGLMALAAAAPGAPRGAWPLALGFTAWLPLCGLAILAAGAAGAGSPAGALPGSTWLAWIGLSALPLLVLPLLHAAIFRDAESPPRGRDRVADGTDRCRSSSNR